MHKCHNYHAILHKLYTWFGKNELGLYLNGAEFFFDGGGSRPLRPPLNTPMLAGPEEPGCRTFMKTYLAGVESTVQFC